MLARIDAILSCFLRPVAARKECYIVQNYTKCKACAKEEHVNSCVGDLDEGGTDSPGLFKNFQEGDPAHIHELTLADLVIHTYYCSYEQLIHCPISAQD